MAAKTDAMDIKVVAYVNGLDEALEAIRVAQASLMEAYKAIDEIYVEMEAE